MNKTKLLGTFYGENLYTDSDVESEVKFLITSYFQNIEKSELAIELNKQIEFAKSIERFNTLEKVRKFLKDFEKHHTLTRSLLAEFESEFNN